MAVLLYLICFRNTRESVKRGATQISLRRTFRMLRQNRPLIVLCLAAFFLLASMFTMNAVALYYARHILGNAGWYTLLMLAQTIGTVIVASLVPGITTRFGKRNGYLGAAVVTIAAFVLIYLVPDGNLAFGLVGWFLFGVGTGGTNALMFSMQADTVDYGEWRTGVRSEGGSYSILSFIRKCGQGLGGWAGAAVIGAYGYVAQADVQDAPAQTGIRLATGALPAVLAVLAAVVILGYNLTSDQHREIIRELHARRSEGAVSSSYGVETSRVRTEELGDDRDLLLRPRGRGVLPVVTLFEREGAGLSEIAPAVAKRLGVAYIPQKFSSDQVADADVQVLASDSAFQRWLRTVSYTGTQDSDLAQALATAEDHSVATQNSAELLKYAEDGAVIAGRNGAVVLGRAVGSLHVRLTAPLDRRVNRVMAKTGLTAPEAEARIAFEDSMRAEMSRSLYRWNPHDDEYYDLVINTATVTYDQVVDMIVHFYRSKYPDAVSPD